VSATLLGNQRVRTVTIVPETPTGYAEAWEFDCVVNMSESNPGQAYRHPLQNGQEGITDGTRLEPPEFSVDGIVTDTPVRYLLPKSHQGAAALYEQIKAMRARQIPLTVITSWAGTMRSRWPEVISGSHGAKDGASIGITINFVRVRIARLQLIASQVDSDVLLLGSQSVSISQPVAG